MVKCPNGYNKTTFTSNFFVNETESKVCDTCKNFYYSNGIATCKLYTDININESSNMDKFIID